MITVSLCMIVKNEEQVLARCLDSLQGLYDELIIMDTGSTDSTKEIAEKYGAKIFDFTWIDDFSKARNAAFEKCTMDYIYSADADEVLDETNRERFRLLKENLLDEIEIVQMLYVNRHEFATTENFEKEYRPKLFKRLRKFTWIEPIHEMVNLNPVVYDSDIEILHMPTSLHSGRDLNVFRKATERNEFISKRLAGMYARELIKSGSEEDIKLAAPFFENAWYDNVHYDDMQDECCCVMTKYARTIGDEAEFHKWSSRNMMTGLCAEVCLETAYYYFDKKDFFEAITWAEYAADKYQPILDIDTAKNAYLLLSKIYKELSLDENAPAIFDYDEKSEEYLKLAKEQ